MRSAVAANEPLPATDVGSARGARAGPSLRRSRDVQSGGTRPLSLTRVIGHEDESFQPQVERRSEVQRVKRPLRRLEGSAGTSAYC